MPRDLSAAARTELPDLPPGGYFVGYGPHGPIVKGLQDRWADAVVWLRAAQTGDAVGVLAHPEVPGRIDVVWGDQRAGLQHIVERHPEVLADLPERLARMRRIDTNGNEIVLASDDGLERAVIVTDYFGDPKTWLLTAYDRRYRSGGGVVEGAPGSRGPDPSSPSRPDAGNVSAAGDRGKAAGEQRLIPGVEPISTKQKLEADAAKPLRGGGRDMPADSLFGDAYLQKDLFSNPALARDAQRVLDEAGGDLEIIVQTADGATRKVTAREALREAADDARAADELIDCIGEGPKP